MLTNLFNDGKHLCDCETILCFPDATRRGLFVFVEFSNGLTTTVTYLIRTLRVYDFLVFYRLWQI